MFKVVIGYPSAPEEVDIVYRVTNPEPVQTQPILTIDQLLELQRQATRIYVDPAVTRYAVQLVGASRRPADFGLPEMARYISYGASPRGSINLILGAKALAVLRGRVYVTPADVEALALDTLRHRMVLSYEALAEEVTADMILTKVMQRVPAPRLELVQEEVQSVTYMAPSEPL
jgi:MoxR-like ATPase